MDNVNVLLGNYNCAEIYNQKWKHLSKQTLPGISKLNQHGERIKRGHCSKKISQ